MRGVNTTYTGICSLTQAGFEKGIESSPQTQNFEFLYLPLQTHTVLDEHTQIWRVPL